MFVPRRRKFFYGFGQLVNRLLGEVGGEERDLEALPLNFPFPVCSHFLTPFLFIFYPIIEPVQFTATFCKAFFSLNCVYLHLVVRLISSQTTMEHEVACLDITPTRKESNNYI